MPPFQNGGALDLTHSQFLFGPQLRLELDEHNKVTEQEAGSYYRHLCKLASISFLQSLFQLGWSPQGGGASWFSAQSLLSSLRILPRHKNYVSFFLSRLAELGLLEERGGGGRGDEVGVGDTHFFRFSGEPPSSADLAANLRLGSLTNTTTTIPEPPPPDYQVYKEIGRELGGVLSGRTDPLSILFPGDDDDDPASKRRRPGAAALYESLATIQTVPLRRIMESVILPEVRSQLNSATTTTTTPPPVFRILEVGAGTGSFSRVLLACLRAEEAGIRTEYHFTDVSTAYFAQAERDFGDYDDDRVGIRFRKLDMDKDPLGQGFTPQYFDMMFAAEVLHVAKDIKQALASLRLLLKPGGVFVITETMVPDPRATFVFGLLEGYWRYEDFDFRRTHATLSGPMWEVALSSAGFTDIVISPTYMGVHGVILAVADGGGGGGGGRNGAEHYSARRKVTVTPRHSWIIFGGGDDDDDDEENAVLQESIAGELARVNRKVIIFRGRDAKLPGRSESDVEFKEGLRPWFDSARESGLELEGVLYLWGLRSGRESQDRISLAFVSICQLLSQQPGIAERPKIVAVTGGAYYPTTEGSDSGMVASSPSGGTLTGIIRALQNENPSLTLLHRDIICRKDSSPEVQARQLISTLWTADNNNNNNNNNNKSVVIPSILAFRGRAAMTPKLVRWKPPNSDYLELPPACRSRFQLVLPQSRLISDLEFAPLHNSLELAEGEIEVEVKAVALNFKDALTILKPSPRFHNCSAIGQDCAGVVTKVGPGVVKEGTRMIRVGDPVVAMNLDESSTLPSHIRVKVELTLPLPDSMTFAEGATLPAVFCTAYHSLVEVAPLSRGSTLLLHTATGGVGLAAIQLAKRAGAQVIATAGSRRKREYLRRRLGIGSVFSSRSAEFGAQVMQVTGGRGVDMVLNSLTGPGLKEESLRVLRHGGKFVEMSKLSVWSPEEVAALRPDVEYTIVDIASFEAAQFSRLRQKLESYLSQNLFRPIPHERFDALNIRGALNYLQKAKHIGKVVCVMPELGGGGGGDTGGGPQYYEMTPLFNQQSTYLVTGGLGGIGWEVVKWILGSGGKHVVIASRRRSCPNQPEIAERIQSWAQCGKVVQVFAVDIGDWEQCRELLEWLESTSSGLPPLRGVMHAAGVLSDGVLENQSWAKFRQVYRAKVEGSWNLHQLTSHLALEHFVLFSSVSSTFGTPGQSNHSGANSFLDTLANYRTSVGLPATSVNWGQWGEVGVATELDFPGMSPISTAQGIRALELFLRTPQTSRAVVANIDSFPQLATLYPNVKEFLEDKDLLFGGVHPPAANPAAAKLLLNTDEFWAEVDSSHGQEEKQLSIFRDLVKSTVRSILRLESSEGIEDDADLVSLGVDSLMMLELKNGLQNVLGRSRLTLSGADLKDGTTPSVLAARLLKMSEGTSWQSGEELPSLEELKSLIRRDSILPEHITPAAASSTTLPLKRIDHVGTILLTGVTGNLGPYLLRELSGREHISKIVCLIRKKGKGSPRDRLMRTLDKFKLTEEVDLAKVEVILGNIAEPQFGLSESAYRALGEEVDAVVHSAVRADHDGKYWAAPSTHKDNMRTVNILGTLHVLQFCTQWRHKHLLHTSTMVTVADVDEAGSFSEDWQDVGAFDDMGFNWGYPLTKHVGEQLVRQAVERGLSAKTFRFPLIGGDGRDGRVDYQNSHVLLRWLAVLKFKGMPESPFPVPCIPVDQCAALSLAVFFNPEAGSDVYTLTQRNPDREGVLRQVAKEEFGIDVQLLPTAQFMRAIQAEDDSSPLAPFRRLYTEDQFSRAVRENMRWLRVYEANPHNFFGSEKMSRFLPDFEKGLAPARDCFRRDLRYLRDSGVFHKFGIELDQK